MLRVLLTLGIGLPILGFLFARGGFKEQDIARASSQAPETISLDRLIARGPEGNANIVLTDYVPLNFHVVKRGKRGRWDGAWVPVVPRDAGGGESPRAVKAVVYSDKGRSPEEIFQRLSDPRLPGMVSNRILTPDDDVKDKLRQQYPQTDFSTCVYIHEGREPASETKSALMIYGGIGAVVLGLGALGLAGLVWQRQRARGAGQAKGHRNRRPRDDEDEDDRPRKRRSRARDDDEEDAPPRKRRFADDAEDDDRPRRKRRAADEDEDDLSRGRRAAREDEDDDRPRRRSRRDDD